jgi:hypothetical protein
VAIFAVRRMDVRFEQRFNIKFCVKLDKTATETLQLLRDVYGDEVSSRARVFVWHRRFVLGRVTVEDDTRSSRPSSSRNEENVIRIRDMIREDRTVTVRMLADFFLFPRLKKRLKGRRHENIEAVQAAVTMELTGMPKQASTSCFQDL